MRKYPLIGVSICAVVLIVLGSFNNIIGYQTVQASNQKIITSEPNEKDLLFQTIVDMENNKEIQRVILGSEFIGKRFNDLGMRFSTFTFPVLTDKSLERIYTIGVVLFRTLSKTKVHTMLEKYHVNDGEMQRKLSSIIEKDATLKAEKTQLVDFECDCKNTTQWNFPVICLILYPLAILTLILYSFTKFFELPYIIMYLVGATLKCFWFEYGERTIIQ